MPPFKIEDVLNRPGILVVPSLLIILVCLAFQGRGQLHPETILASENWFDHKVGIENSGILNGSRYKMEFLGASSNPFFGTGENSGMVNLDRQNYSATLLYDIYKDEIIVKHINNSGLGWFIQLDKKAVTEFVIAGHLFRNIEGAFREVLFESKNFLVVARRSKSRYVKGNIRNYIQNDEYFTMQNGKWNRLWTLSGLKQLLATKEEKEAYKLFLSQNDLKNRKFPDEDLVKASRFVDGLAKTTGI